MRVGSLVTVKNCDGSLGLSDKFAQRDAHRHLKEGEMGIVVGLPRLNWIVAVLFPPGKSYDVVIDHLHEVQFEELGDLKL